MTSWKETPKINLVHREAGGDYISSWSGMPGNPKRAGVKHLGNTLYLKWKIHYITNGVHQQY